MAIKKKDVYEIYIIDPVELLGHLGLGGILESVTYSRSGSMEVVFKVRRKPKDFVKDNVFPQITKVKPSNL